MIVGVDVDATGQVWTWYSDLTVSRGNAGNLAAGAAPVAYSLAPGKTAADVLEMAIHPTTCYVHVWYRDGRTSVGSAYDLDRFGGLSTFGLPAGRTAAQIVGVGFDGSRRTVTFTSPLTFTRGNTADLDQYVATSRFDVPDFCGFGAHVHELGHTVGLFHEQTRSDRDSFVRINLANVQADKTGNFAKYTNGFDHGAYDLGSIMHYGSFAFAINPSIPTITRLDGSTFSANRTALSAGDIAIVEWMY